jgi:hypothetical protein
MVLPKQLNMEASSSYGRNNHRMNNNFPLLCEVLVHYLDKKQHLTAPAQLENNDAFKYNRNAPLPLQFYDFFIVEQGYMFALAYLDSSDTYGFEYDGLVELSAMLSIYLFKNMTKENDFHYYRIGNKMEDNPGGYYKFKSNTNVVSYIDDVIDGISGIYEYEDEDNDEEFDDD